MDLNSVCERLRAASRLLAQSSTEQKNTALAGVTAAIDAERQAILAANARDVDAARKAGMKESLIDRLILTDSRIDGILESIAIVIRHDDPVGQVVSGKTLANGLDIREVRVPLGIAAIIYESRPNVTVDAFALAYKSGNAILLRGSSSALESNRAITAAIRRGLEGASGIADAVALADSGDRSDVDWIINARGMIDVVLPRGSAGLIRQVVDNARVPVIETGSGVCHLYIDDSARPDMAVPLAVNAKLQRPGVCNSIETLLVHSSIADRVLPGIAAAFAAEEKHTGVKGGAQFRCCARSLPLMKGAANVTAAVEEDYGCEFLDYILAVKIVDSVEEAVAHINKFNTKHSESIITDSRDHARYFQREVDAACVYVNASTRFTDGGVFGFGAELGISTQKMHVRGPMGIAALTTTKYLIDGEGQIR